MRDNLAKSIESSDSAFKPQQAIDTAKAQKEKNRTSVSNPEFDAGSFKQAANKPIPMLQSRRSLEGAIITLKMSSMVNLR